MPIELAGPDIDRSSFKNSSLQIQKAINSQLVLYKILIQKMHLRSNKSAILTLTSVTSYISRVNLGQGFPILASTSQFTQTLAESVGEASRR